MLHAILATALNASLACGSPQACQTQNTARSCCGSPPAASQTMTIGDLDGMRVRCDGQSATLHRVDENSWAIVRSGQVRGLASLVSTPQGPELVARGLPTAPAAAEARPLRSTQGCCGSGAAPRAAAPPTGCCKPTG